MLYGRPLREARCGAYYTLTFAGPGRCIRICSRWPQLISETGKRVRRMIMDSRAIASRFAVASVILLFASTLWSQAQHAPGAPGSKPTWTNGNKEGLGTSATANSKVWFTLGEDGTLNEVYYPAIDSANTRALELIVTDGKSFTELESRDIDHAVEVPDPAALVFTQVNKSRSGRYEIRKTYITDPSHDTVLIQIQMKVLKLGPLRVFAYFDPALKNSGLHDSGFTSGKVLLDTKGSVACALAASPGFV